MIFLPNFSSEREIWANQFIKDTCISLFSVGTESNLPIVSFDSSISQSILSIRKDIPAINSLAILFDFYSLLGIKNDEIDSILLALRKLFALAFYSVQFKERGESNLEINEKHISSQYNNCTKDKLLTEILGLLQYLSKEGNAENLIDEELLRFSAATVSFALANISDLVKSIRIDMKSSNNMSSLILITDIINISFDLFNRYFKEIVESHFYFAHFFLSILYSFDKALENNKTMKSEEERKNNTIEINEKIKGDNSVNINQENAYNEDIFQRALEKAAETLRNFPSQTFNFGTLLIHLLKFFNDDFYGYYSFESQVGVLKLIACILDRHPQFSEFLFNAQNFELIFKFLVKAISSPNIQTDMKIKQQILPKYNFDLNKAYTPSEIISVDTFSNEEIDFIYHNNHRNEEAHNQIDKTLEIIILDDENNSSGNNGLSQNDNKKNEINLENNVNLDKKAEIKIDYEFPEDLPSFSQCSYFKSLLAALFLFCKMNPTGCHPQFIKRIIVNLKETPTYSFASFLLMWGRDYIAQNKSIKLTADTLAKVGYFDKILELSFDTLRCDEYINFICKLYPYILKNFPENLFFMTSLFSRHEIMTTEFKYDEKLHYCLIECCQISPKILSHLFIPIFYDQRLSNLSIYLQSRHIEIITQKLSLASSSTITAKDISIIENNISKVRKMFFEYLVSILSIKIYRCIFYVSSLFEKSMFLMIFEKATNKFAIHFLTESLQILTYRDRSLSSIFNFFQQLFKDVQQDQRLKPISTQVLQIVASSFESNTENIAGIFLHSSFFPTLVDYVSFIKSEKNMYLLLDIAQKCTALKGALADYLAEMDLFSKIYPLTQSIFENGVPNDFLNYLWSIVFNNHNSINNTTDFRNNFVMNYLENDDTLIINAAPLTLIYRLLFHEDDKFLSFVGFIQKCCDTNIKSALELNNSDFPSAVISSFEEFHDMTDPSPKFDAILALFSSLAAHSLRSRDALSFFHNFSTLKGNFRPYFTLDLLRTLLFLFQSPYDSPYSFYQIDKSKGIIYLPSVPIQALTSFTFFVQMELTEKQEHIGVLFSIETLNFHFTIFFKDSKLYFESGYSNNKNGTIYGSFDYIFPPNTWTHIAITFRSEKLCLYVHGKEQANLKLPKFSIPAGNTRSYVARNISCNIGNFGFVRTCLSPQTIKLMSIFPKTAVTAYSPPEISDFSYDMVPLFQGELYQESIYLYNAAVSFTNKNSSVNLAPNNPQQSFQLQNEQQIPPQLDTQNDCLPLNIMRVEGGHIYGYSPQAKDMLRSIGGASAFLPIFAQIDQPLKPKSGEEIKYSFDPTFLPFLIQVLTAFLQNSPSNQEDFATMNGFMVIGYLLSRSKLQNITPQVIEMLKRLYKEILVPRLAYQMLEFLFLDIRLWIYLPIDLQLNVYSTILDLFNSSQNSERSRWFVWALPFNKVMYIMRVFFWSKFTDDSICLCQQPKKNKIDKKLIEGVRPKETHLIRDMFWRIAGAIYTSSFNQNSASTLCFLSFDQSDPVLSFETLSFLLYLLRIKNPIMITTLISQNYTFETFFSLLASDNESIRAQCIHIFILFDQLDQFSREALLKPYNEHDWIAGIMATMNTKGITSVIPDIIFGYMFGFFDIRQNAVMPSCRISAIPKKNIVNGFSFAKLSLFPLAMMVIADLPDDLCTKYLLVIDRSIAIEVPNFIKLVDWELPFVMLLIHRLPTSQSKFDQASYTCLHTLCCVYGITMNTMGTINALQNFIIGASSRMGQDFTHILRHVYTYFFDSFLLKVQHNEIPPLTIYTFLDEVFEFLFVVASTDHHFLPPYDQMNISIADDYYEDNIEGCNSRVTFQELHRNQWNAAMLNNLSLSYATRTKSNGIWIDSELAQRLLRAYTMYPIVFSLKLKAQQMNPLFMFSYIMGIGLHLQFPAFEQYIRYLTPRIPADNKGINDIQYQSFINMFAGLTKVYFLTDRTHLSHLYMVELSNAYWQVIMSKFKQKVNIWGTKVEEFDTNFAKNQNNFAHVIIEKFSAIEVSMMKYAKKIQKEKQKLFQQISTKIEKVASHFMVLNPTDSLAHLSVRNEQARLQLYQFAASVRSKHQDCLKVYRALWRALSSEGGPWCSLQQSDTVHWKLDKSQQNTSLIRGRFIINYNFTDHKDASLLRDIGKPDDAERQYQEHLKELRRSQFSENQSVITIGDEADDEDEDENEDNNIHQQQQQLERCRINNGNMSNTSLSKMSSNKLLLKNQNAMFSVYTTGNIIMKADANRVTMKRVYKGLMMLTRTYLIFQCVDTKKKPKNISIPLSTITHIFTRRYLLMDTAIEIFSSAQKAYMIDFALDQRAKVLEEILKLHLPNIDFLQTCDQDAVPYLEHYKTMWANGKISNFEYLMKLNLYSGRTYNDLSQYPIFPWIIADYTSSELNLDDSHTFRDLSRPIGTLDEQRLHMMTERMHDDANDFDYLYGSFYTSPAVVVGYLIRVEPFTSLHIILQDGKFDQSSRLFSSIPKAWESVCKTPMDFRELIPEFFYMPDFLVNRNNFDLGKNALDNVELPPWASSPRDFVTKNRQALESRYVSAMLPRWIDLIFGVSSRGNDAFDLDNVFHPFFFESSITKEVLNNPEKLGFIQEYAACFGHAPRQLFDEPHRSKKVAILGKNPLTQDTNSISNFSHKFVMLLDTKSPILSLEILKTPIDAMTATNVASSSTTFNSSSTVKTDKSVPIVSSISVENNVLLINSKFELVKYDLTNYSATKLQLPLNFAINLDDVQSMTNTVQTLDGFAISSVPWDTSISIFSANNGVCLHSKRIHTKKITRIAMSPHFYATASLDCTVILWRMFPSCPQVPMAIMSKHRSIITCLEINEKVDLCVSASRSGEIVTQSLVTGNFIRKITVSNAGEPTSIVIFNTGTICVSFAQSDSRTAVYTFDQNLELFEKHVQLESSLQCWKPFEWAADEIDYLFAAMKSGSLIIYKVPEFKAVWIQEKMDFMVSRIEIAYNPLQVLIGTMCGKVISLPFCT